MAKFVVIIIVFFIASILVVVNEPFKNYGLVSMNLVALIISTLGIIIPCLIIIKKGPEKLNKRKIRRRRRLPEDTAP